MSHQGATYLGGLTTQLEIRDIHGHGQRAGLGDSLVRCPETQQVVGGRDQQLECAIGRESGAFNVGQDALHKRLVGSCWQCRQPVLLRFAAKPFAVQPSGPNLVALLARAVPLEATAAGPHTREQDRLVLFMQKDGAHVTARLRIDLDVVLCHSGHQTVPLQDQWMRRQHVVGDHHAQSLGDDSSRGDQPVAELLSGQLPDMLGLENVERWVARSCGEPLESQAEVISLGPRHSKSKAECSRGCGLPRTAVAAQQEHSPEGADLGLVHRPILPAPSKTRKLRAGQELAPSGTGHLP